MLLVQQYYENPKFGKFLEDNFVLYRAPRGDIVGDEIFKKFRVPSTPFILFLDKDGRDVDWIKGYAPPPEKLHARFLKIIQGVDTYKSLSTACDADPKNADALVKLGLRIEERFGREKAAEMYKKALALDPGDGSVRVEYKGEPIPVGELAEYLLAHSSIFSDEGINFVPLDAFIKKYPSSKLTKSAYMAIATYVGVVPGLTVGGRTNFAEEMVEKYPDDPEVLAFYINQVMRIRSSNSKYPVERGIALAEKLAVLTKTNPNPGNMNTLAWLYAQKGDVDKAAEMYGKDFFDGRVKSLSESLLKGAAFWISQKKNLDEAERMMETAVRMNPSDAKVRRSAAGLYLSSLRKSGKAMELYGPEFLPMIQEDPEELFNYFDFWAARRSNSESAMAAVRGLLRIKPESTYFASQAAESLCVYGMPEKALEIYGPEFIKNHADHFLQLKTYALFWLGKKKNIDSASETLDAALRLRPGDVDLPSTAAKLLKKAGKPEKALEIYGSSFAEKIKGNAASLFSYALFWMNENSNLESAAAALKTAIELAPDKNKTAYRQSAASQLIRTNHLAEAEALFGPEYLKTIRDDAESLAVYADFWSSRNLNLDSAREAAGRAAEIAATAVIWDKLAWSFSNLKMYEEALKAAENAVRLSGANVPGVYKRRLEQIKEALAKKDIK